MAVLRHADNALVREMTVQVVSQAVATNPTGLGSGTLHRAGKPSFIFHQVETVLRQVAIWQADIAAHQPLSGIQQKSDVRSGCHESYCRKRRDSPVGTHSEGHCCLGHAAGCSSARCSPKPLPEKGWLTCSECCSLEEHPRSAGGCSRRPVPSGGQRSHGRPQTGHRAAVPGGGHTTVTSPNLSCPSHLALSLEM